LATGGASLVALIDTRHEYDDLAGAVPADRDRRGGDHLRRRPVRVHQPGIPCGRGGPLFVSFGIDYSVQVTVFRIAVFVLPTLAYFLTKRICEELAESRWRPIAGRPGPTVKRTAAGGFKQPTGGRRG
jgi:hypothetical protein